MTMIHDAPSAPLPTFSNYSGQIRTSGKTIYLIDNIQEKRHNLGCRFLEQFTFYGYVLAEFWPILDKFGPSSIEPMILFLFFSNNNRLILTPPIHHFDLSSYDVYGPALRARMGDMYVVQWRRGSHPGGTRPDRGHARHASSGKGWSDFGGDRAPCAQRGVSAIAQREIRSACLAPSRRTQPPSASMSIYPARMSRSRISWRGHHAARLANYRLHPG